VRSLIDKLAKSRIIYPLRKLGLVLATYWPFPVKATLQDGSTMWVDLRSAIGRAILVKGEYDYEVWRAIEGILRPGDVFVDVGANVGYYALLASRRVGRSGQVHAFEIDPRPLRCLRINAKECQNHNLTLHEVAVGDLEGFGVLVAAQDCGHSAVQQAGRGMTVAMLSLDHWMERQGTLSHVDVIKLDIEGGELAALEGAKRLIEKHRPSIICEAWDEGTAKNVPGKRKILSFFESVNYSTDYAVGTCSLTIVALPR